MTKISRVLAVDVGNTSTTLGVFDGGTLKQVLRCPTRQLNRKWLKTLKKQLSRYPIDLCAVASVVPSAQGFLKRGLSGALGVPVVVLGKDQKVPIVNRYRNPRQVGVDRLVNALAAYRRYHKEVIVIDFGTAVTFDVVSRKGEYLGGVIAPGIEISIEALYERTALLPKIQLTRPRSILGRDTAESIKAGCSYGIAGLCERIVKEIAHFCRFNRPVIIATGGHAAFISGYFKPVNAIDPHLTLRGIFYSVAS